MVRDYKRWATTTWQDIIFPDVIGRLNYLVRGIVMWLLTYVLIAPVQLLDFWLKTRPPTPILLIERVYLIVGLVALIWLSLRSVYFPRIHDIGLPKKAAWLLLIPGLNIVFPLLLLIVPSRREDYCK